MRRRTVAIAIFAGILAAPLVGQAAPDENQRQWIQRAQEAKKKLAAAEAARGAERQKMMQEHMKIMDELMAQMQKAKPAAGMTPDQMREWMDEHMKLMREMMDQMMAEHHMMMQGMNTQGMGKK